MLSKKKLIIPLIILSVIFSGLLINAANSHTSLSINDILKAAEFKKNFNPTEEDNAIAIEVNGAGITNGEIELQKNQMMAVSSMDEKTAYKAVIKELIKNRALYKKAEELNLVPTFEEAKKASLEEWKAVKQDPNALDNMNLYIDALGLAEDQHWNEYHVYETQRYLAAELVKKGITDEAVNRGELPKVKVHTKDTSKQYKDYINKYMKDFESKTQIKVKNEKYLEYLND